MTTKTTWEIEEFNGNSWYAIAHGLDGKLAVIRLRTFRKRWSQSIFRKVKVVETTTTKREVVK